MVSIAVDYALFSDVKAYLDITWEDEVTNRKIRNFITQGMFFINDKLGAEGDYLHDGHPRTLLFEYARYARDGALDVFETNYKSMILAMQNNKKVKDHAAKTAVSAGE